MRDLEKEPKITEDWLRECGFKWHQFDRQPEKQWLLWLGDALVDYSEPNESRRMFSSYEELGIELSFSDRFWHCWLRSDTSHRYRRFLHTRHLVYQFELVEMIEGLTGREFRACDCMYGAMKTPLVAERLRAESDRLDRRIHRGQHPWRECEKDPDRGRPLAEHVQAAIDGGKAR